MGKVKDMLLNEKYLLGEEHDDVCALYHEELEQLAQESILPDYVILTNGHKCYLGDDCDPQNNVCKCV